MLLKFDLHSNISKIILFFINLIQRLFLIILFFIDFFVLQQVNFKFFIRGGGYFSITVIIIINNFNINKSLMIKMLNNMKLFLF